MRVDVTLHDYLPLIPPGLLSPKKTTFVEDVIEAQLDPRFHFRFADLRGVNFANCDLRGFDFTGADLTGCIGTTNVIWDTTTVLDGASVAGSFFAYEKSRRRLFAYDTRLRKRLDILKRSETFQAINWVAGRLRSTSRSDAEEIAKALLLESPDRPVRTNMLFFLSRAFESKDSHREYLLALLAMGDRSPVSAREVYKVLADFHASDETVVGTLVATLFEAEDDWLKDVCMRGLMRSPNFKKIAPELSGILQDLPEVTRRKFTEVLAHAYGRSDLVREPKGSGFLDFSVPLTPSRIEDMATAILYRRHIDRSVGRREGKDRWESTFAYAPKAEDIDRQIDTLVDSFEYLIQKGLPFRLGAHTAAGNLKRTAKPEAFNDEYLPVG